VTTAFIPGFGTVGAVIATWTYVPNDAPNYHRGNSINVASTSALCVLALVGYFYCKWENKQRDMGLRDYRIRFKSDSEAAKLGWKHPEFRYVA